MDDVVKFTLSAMASRYLSSLSQERRQDSQPEVTKFIRWCGRDRAISEITNQEVAQYASGLGNSPSAGRGYEVVRAFLAYAHKQGATRANLAASFRLKKASGAGLEVFRRPQAVTELTEEGHSKLRAELRKLKERRVAIAEELRRAAADKDVHDAGAALFTRPEGLIVQGDNGQLVSVDLYVADLTGLGHRTAEKG